MRRHKHVVIHQMRRRDLRGFLPRPAVSETAEVVYTGLGPLTTLDEANDWHLLKFVDALVSGLTDVDVLARDHARPGWGDAMDPNVTPIYALGWLGQFVGVDLLVGLDDTSQRLRVKETAGFKRGTTGALEGAARQTLTGTRQVMIFERDTSPYHLTVRTYLAETPDQALTEAVIRSLKPAGLVLQYQVATGATYAQLDTSYTTYAAMDAAFTTYEAQTLWIP